MCLIAVHRTEVDGESQATESEEHAHFLQLSAGPSQRVHILRSKL